MARSVRRRIPEDDADSGWPLSVIATGLDATRLLHPHASHHGHQAAHYHKLHTTICITSSRQHCILNSLMLCHKNKQSYESGWYKPPIMWEHRRRRDRASLNTAAASSEQPIVANCSNMLLALLQGSNTYLGTSAPDATSTPNASTVVLRHLLTSSFESCTVVRHSGVWRESTVRATTGLTASDNSPHACIADSRPARVQGRRTGHVFTCSDILTTIACQHPLHCPTQLLCILRSA